TSSPPSTNADGTAHRGPAMTCQSCPKEKVDCGAAPETLTLPCQIVPDGRVGWLRVSHVEPTPSGKLVSPSAAFVCLRADRDEVCTAVPTREPSCGRETRLRLTLGELRAGGVHMRILDARRDVLDDGDVDALAGKKGPYKSSALCNGIDAQLSGRGLYSK